VAVAGDNQPNGGETMIGRDNDGSYGCSPEELARLLAVCHDRGVEVAWIHNHWADTGVECAREHIVVRDGYEQIDSLAGLVGDVAREWFAEGYDATIDFSLNSDWRESKAQ
jgi:hypothetical protein